MPLTYDQDKLRKWLAAVQARTVRSGQGRGRLSTQLLMSGGAIPGLPVTTPLTQLLNTGVLVGCDVTQHSTGADMSVDVADGSIMYQNTPATVAAVNVAIVAADATQDRIDAVVANPSGVVSVLTGAINDGSNAQAPVTTGYVLLATVYVVSQLSTNYTGTIVTAAILAVETLLLVHTTPYRVSGLWYGVGAFATRQGLWANNDMFLIPFFTAKNLAIRAIGVWLAINGTAGSKGRLGIYQDDGAGGLALLVDAGQVALDAGAASGFSLPISQTLSPGWWWLAIAFQSLGGTIPNMAAVQPPATSPVGGATLAAAQAYPGGIRYAGISGALPATPSSPDYSWANKYPAIWIQTT